MRMRISRLLFRLAGTTLLLVHGVYDLEELFDLLTGFLDMPLETPG